MNKPNKHDRGFYSIVPGNGFAVKVCKSKRNPNGDITAALGKWKRIVKDSGRLQDMKDRQEYTKPSEIKREQLNKAKFKEKYRIDE